MKHGFYEGDDGTLYLEWETDDGLACSIDIKPDGSELYFVRDDLRTDDLFERKMIIASMGNPVTFEDLKQASIAAGQNQ